jgi:hypothetical protein
MEGARLQYDPYLDLLQSLVIAQIAGHGSNIGGTVVVEAPTIPARTANLEIILIYSSFDRFFLSARKNPRVFRIVSKVEFHVIQGGVYLALRSSSLVTQNHFSHILKCDWL